MRDLVDQAPCRVLAIIEEARIAQCHSQQGWLHAADQLLYRCQQAFVAGDVVDHQGHHFQPQLLAQTLCGTAHLVARCLCRRLVAHQGGRWPLPTTDALHDLIHLLHFAQGLEGCRHGGSELAWRELAVLKGVVKFAREALRKTHRLKWRIAHFELARQELSKLVERQQRFVA